ncbi:MAG: carboxymuconolactone decarboxylase family protein [Prevotellaceae bacterium]|nr:carboxymuconolactone decarboxylase family protein [Candidatus Minthosoma equi]
MKEIKINEHAKQQIRRLFSQRNSINTLKSDPELTEIFDNFAFDEALKLTEGPVLEKTRVMCILASTIGCNAMREFRVYVDVCLNVGVKPREIREVVYQTVPYVGFSKMVDYLEAMNSVFDNNDIRLPLSDQSTTTPENRREKGREWIDGIFGAGTAEQMEKNAPKGQEHIVEFLESYCFGDFYTRNGIDMQHRELVTFCLIASMGVAQPQLESHAFGCKNMEISKTEMVAVLTGMLPYIGFPKTLNALTAVNKAYPEEE